MTDKYFVYEIAKYKSKIRALIWHVKIDDETKESTFVSEYSVCVDLDTWMSYCTCIGFQMRKKQCIHLKTLFNDNKYKELCKNDKEQKT